jgi:2-polyprenyl-3-methyl-5-hydroxy-6-metoxy-1,4-benzoquinol methylase
MTGNFERIQKFKEQAWNTKGAARWYAIAVNDSFGIEDIDLATQLRLLESQVTPRARIADIGCGTGALSIDLASKGYEVTGFDISSFMLNELKKRAKNIPIKTVEADVFNLNSSHGLYDAAISRWVLPHFPNWGEIVLSVGKVLRSGGVFVFDVKNLEHDEFAKGLAGSNAIGTGSDESLDLVDPFYYTTKVTDAAIHSVLEDSGFELVSRTPFGLLASNVLISEGASEKELRTRRRLLNFMTNRSRALRNLMEAIERNLTPYIPVHLVHRSFVVARKK